MSKRGRKPSAEPTKAEPQAMVTTQGPPEMIGYLGDDEMAREPVILALVPPDLSRCQCEWPDQTLPTFGPKPIVRCEHAPTVVGFQKRVPGDLEPSGAMSLCDEHKLMLDHMFPQQLFYRRVTSEKKVGSYVE